MHVTERKFEKFRGAPTQSKADRVYATIDKRFVISMNKNLHRLLDKPTPNAFVYRELWPAG